jgi:hypothetical protein
MLETSDHLASSIMEQPHPLDILSPCLTGSPDRETVSLKHTTTLASKLAEPIPNPGPEKKKFPTIDTEFGAAIRRAKEAYIKTQSGVPKGSWKPQQKRNNRRGDAGRRIIKRGEL